jgi:hypothetical protein
VNVAIEIDLTRWGGVRPRLQQQQRFFIRFVSQTKCQSSNGDKAARRTFIVEGRRQKNTQMNLSLYAELFSNRQFKGSVSGAVPINPRSLFISAIVKNEFKFSRSLHNYRLQ